MRRAKSAEEPLSDKEEFEYERTGGPLKYYNRRRVRKRFKNAAKKPEILPIEAQWYFDLVEDFRQRRQELGIAQQKLASLLDTNQGVISRLENGKANLTAELIDRISKALKLEIVVVTRKKK